jgi:hypothetical protein
MQSRSNRIPILTSTSPLHAEQWFSALRANGLIFHPDDDPAEIVDVISGEAVFSASEIAQLRSTMSMLFTNLGDATYDICHEEMLKNFVAT